MQKIFVVAILLFALLGCEAPMEETYHQIGFASQINRSIVEEVGDLYNEGVKLFGTATLNGDVIRLFDAEKLYCSSSMGDWEYVNTRYWVPQAKHSFWALWPYTTACTFSEKAGNVTINHTSNATSADLLYSTATRDLTNSEDYSTVPLVLHHACAALEFNVINASDKEITSISNIYLVGLKNMGTFTFGIDGSAAWAVDSSVVAATDSETYRGRTDLSDVPVNLNTKLSLYEGGAILVVPQEIGGTDVKFHVAISGYPDKTVSLGNLGSAAPSKWEAGKRYEYTLTIKENEIVSNVKVVPWVDHYVDL